MWWRKTPDLWALVLGCGLGLLSWTSPSGALEADAKQPIEVEADSAEMDDGVGRSIYRGKVVITQGSMRIEAAEVVVEHPNRDPQRIIAKGTPVRFEQRVEGRDQPVRARAERMEYQTAEDLLQLIGRAELEQGQDRFSSDRIRYDRRAGRVLGGRSAEGRERVRIQIDPNRP